VPEPGSSRCCRSWVSGSSRSAHWGKDPHRHDRHHDHVRDRPSRSHTSPADRGGPRSRARRFESCWGRFLCADLGFLRSWSPSGRVLWSSISVLRAHGLAASKCAGRGSCLSPVGSSTLRTRATRSHHGTLLRIRARSATISRARGGNSAPISTAKSWYSWRPGNSFRHSVTSAAA